MNISDRLKAFFKGKDVLILGFGKEGRSTYELIKDIGCKRITIADKNKIDDPPADCRLCCGENYLNAVYDCDIIMKAPGIGLKNDVPDKIKSKITSQTDLFLRFCDSKIIGVTGTKGKSTTSSLIYHFLRSCGKKTALIGNIGVPPLEKAAEFDEDTVVVCEMSCHQLEYVQASPQIAVLLNIYPEHLDHYTDFESYAQAKLNIFRYQKKDDLLIIFDKIKWRAADAQSKVITAGMGEGDIGTNGGDITLGKFNVLKKDIVTKLAGDHNLYNIAVALYAAISVGCDSEVCVESLADFKCLEHRLEYVGIINGAVYINDSISTAPQTAIAALKAYPDTDTLIIGGMDRGISYTALSDYLNTETSVKNLIILPDSGIRAAKDVTNPEIRKIYADNMEQAVKAAKEVTKCRCILSPAAASYGFYKNFEERGRHFKQLLGF